MALVVLLRGVNVGGHRTFQPTKLAAQLKQFGAVNIGAAGTFVFHRPPSRKILEEEIGRRLPVDAEIVICNGRDILNLISRDVFMGYPQRPDTVRFLSVLTKNPRTLPDLPMTFPAKGRWLMKALARDRRFVFGVYRRDMKVIGYLGEMDKVFGVPVTTRNWNTVTAIAKALGHSES